MAPVPPSRPARPSMRETLATVLLVDSNSEMDLSHVGARMAAGRLRVHTMDVFSAKMEALLRSARSQPDALAALQALTHHPGALKTLKEAVENGFEAASSSDDDPQTASLLQRLGELGLLS